MQNNVGYHLNPTTFVWEKGPGYTFKDFKDSIDLINPAFQTEIKRPSDLFFTMSLLILICIYVVVIYLADNWFESNRGHPKNPFGFITKLFKKSKKLSTEKDESKFFLIKHVCI
jgi:hypothetical protein